jgi:hypothetical protein
MPISAGATARPIRPVVSPDQTNHAMIAIERSMDSTSTNSAFAMRVWKMRCCRAVVAGAATSMSGLALKIANVSRLISAVTPSWTNTGANTTPMDLTASRSGVP